MREREKERKKRVRERQREEKMQVMDLETGPKVKALATVGFSRNFLASS